MFCINMTFRGVLHQHDIQKNRESAEAERQGDVFDRCICITSDSIQCLLRDNTETQNIYSLSLLCALLRRLTKLIALQASSYSKPCLLWAVHSNIHPATRAATSDHPGQTLLQPLCARPDLLQNLTFVLMPALIPALTAAAASPPVRGAATAAPPVAAGCSSSPPSPRQQSMEGKPALETVT